VNYTPYIFAAYSVTLMALAGVMIHSIIALRRAKKKQKK